VVKVFVFLYYEGHFGKQNVPTDPFLSLRFSGLLAVHMSSPKASHLNSYLINTCNKDERQKFLDGVNRQSETIHTAWCHWWKCTDRQPL